MFLSIIIVNFNTKGLLHACLISIFQSPSLNFSNDNEIIVVDNHSNDGSAEMVSQLFPSVRLIRNSLNNGFGAANNQALLLSKGEYLLFLNSDSLIHPSFIKNLSGYIQQYSPFGVLGFQIQNRDRSFQPSCGFFPNIPNLMSEALFLNRILSPNSFTHYHIIQQKFYHNAHQVDWVSGSCFLISKDIIQKIKGFDERYFLYVEDVDLCYRIQKLGYKNYFVPTPSIIHQNTGSSNKVAPIVFTYHNLLYFFRKYYSLNQYRMLKIIIFMKSSFFCSIRGLASIFLKRYRDKTKGYYVLLQILIFKNHYIHYENSFRFRS